MKTFLLFVVVLVTICGMSCRSSRSQSCTISLDFTKPGPALSLSMYGIFFEDINHAADGGLYAELIQNRDFESNKVPEDMTWIDDSTIVNPNGWKGSYRRPDDLRFWSLIQEGGAVAQMQLEKRNPLNANNPQSMRFEILKAGKGRAAVANEGFWGIAARKGATYNLSLYARKDSRFDGGLTATLESSSGEKYASQQIAGIDGSWEQFRATLTSSADDPHARFVLAAGSRGTVWLDVVSLFPEETWNMRPNGLRKDLARMLAEMRPSFVRFPGGCVVEGATLENRVQWKRTVGDISARPGHWNLWGYHSTDGLGFHEFLQMCEDLGSTALYVINVGMSCQGRGGMVAGKAEIQNYLREALDALEYAMGPATTHWGAMRAADGHPAPFSIKYVEIGNENGGPDYQAAYRVIQSGIKRKYPDIITIANEPVRLTDQDRKAYHGVSLEMVDEHYYQSPGYFFKESKKYDRYDRSDSVGIYVGEFAVTAGKPGKGNLRAAIGESAFMIGMERNADIVKMASYAPTFVNVNDRAWNPDMIVYNSAQVYGTPSYHAIKMFSLNRPEYVLPTSVVYDVDTTGRKWAHLHGGIALSAWNTKAEYRDIRIERHGQTLFSDDFSTGAARWNQEADQWIVKDGAFQNQKSVTEAIASTGDPSWTDYTLSIKARKISGEEGFIIYMLMNSENQCLWNIGGWGNTVDVLMQDRIDIGKRQDISIETGKWYDIRMEVQGHHIRCYLDGVLKHDAGLHERAEPTIYATSGIRQGGGELVLKIVNPFDEPKTCDVHLQGIQAVEPEGEALVMTSGSPDDENSFENPEKVAPRRTLLHHLGTAFEYVCPPTSISIVKVKIKK